MNVYTKLQSGLQDHTSAPQKDQEHMKKHLQDFHGHVGLVFVQGGGP